MYVGSAFQLGRGEGVLPIEPSETGRDSPAGGRMAVRPVGVPGLGAVRRHRLRLGAHRAQRILRRRERRHPRRP